MDNESAWSETVSRAEPFLRVPKPCGEGEGAGEVAVDFSCYCLVFPINSSK